MLDSGETGRTTNYAVDPERKNYNRFGNIVVCKSVVLIVVIAVVHVVMHMCVCTCLLECVCVCLCVCVCTVVPVCVYYCLKIIGVPVCTHT